MNLSGFGSIERPLSESRRLKESGNYSEAITLLLSTIDSLKTHKGQEQEVVKVLISLAELNRASLSFDLALPYAYRARKRAMRLDESHLLAWVDNRLSAIHFEKWNNDSALYYAQSSQVYLSRLNIIPEEYLWIKASTSILLGAAYRTQKEYEAAKEIFYRAIDGVSKGDIPQTELPIIYFNLSLTLELEDSIDQALKTGVFAYELAEKNNDQGMRRQLAESLVRLYKSQEDYKSALEYLGALHDAAIKIHDSHKMGDLKVKLAQYEYREKEQTNQLLSSSLREKKLQNNVFIGLGILFLLFGLVVFFLYRNTRKANKVLNQQNALIERQRKELMVLDEAKSRFFANVSHELKTPLSLILGPLNQISESEYLPNSIKGNLDLAWANTQRLRELVDEILDLTKVETNKLELKRKPLVFKKFIYRLFYSFQTLAESNGQTMELTTDISDTLCLDMDKDKYEKVVSNLLSNAVKYSGKGSHIQLTIALSKQVLSCTVSDDGSGMTPENTQRVFERFFQGNQGGYQGGLGIGLSLSREYAKLMGGDISAVSDLNEKTTFCFTVRVEETDALINSEPIAALESQTLLEGLKQNSNAHLLLVEDNYEMRTFIKSILAPYLKVSEAPNGKVALEMLQKRTFDIIISDIMMPEMDGFELFQATKSDERLKHVPFIMITAKGDVETKINALNEGVTDYLQKPFLTHELVARVQNILNNVRVIKEINDAFPLEVEVTSVAPEETRHRARQVVLTHLKNEQFDVPALADEMLMSERTLYRNLKSSTGLTPNNFIKEIKLRYARTLLEKESHRSVNEVAEIAGFKNRATFTRLFSKRFGVNPSYYHQT